MSINTRWGAVAPSFPICRHVSVK